MNTEEGSARVGRALALDEYVLSVRELALLVTVGCGNPKQNDDASTLLTTIIDDLVVLDPELAAKAFQLMNGNRLGDITWIVHLASILSSLPNERRI